MGNKANKRDFRHLIKVDVLFNRYSPTTMLSFKWEFSKKKCPVLTIFLEQTSQLIHLFTKQINFALFNNARLMPRFQTTDNDKNLVYWLYFPPMNLKKNKLPNLFFKDLNIASVLKKYFLYRDVSRDCIFCHKTFFNSWISSHDVIGAGFFILFKLNFFCV